MIDNLKKHLEKFQKNKTLSAINLNERYNKENDSNFVIYETSEIVPSVENKKHFSSLASILSIENGYFGTRSCLEECYCDISTGGTYIAGIYMINDDLQTDKLAVMPDWTRICVYIENEVFDLLSQEILAHKRYFNIEKGISVREARVRDSKGRVTFLKTEKFAALHDKNLAGQSIKIIPENYDGKISIRTGIDGNVVNADYAEFEKKSGPDSISLKINLPEKKFKDGEVNPARQVSMTKKSFISLKNKHHQEENILPLRFTGHDEDYIFEEYDIKAEKGKEICLKSIVSIYTTLDSDNPAEDSYFSLKGMQVSFYEKVLKDHIKTMHQRFQDSGIFINGDNISQRYANYSVARLIMAGENNSEKSSITARTLTGPSYAGHVFWDNEIFDLPFFIYTNPKAAKKMLMYRYNTLEGARKNRKVENEEYNTFYKGARFAWESTLSGVERTPMFVTNEEDKKVRIFTGTNEKHITPDIAYATYKYWQATGDDEFMRKYGAEIIFETARYSQSILHEESDGRLHTKNLIGPDEYHEEVSINPINGLKEGVHDNAYTNMLIKHNLEIAIKTAEFLEYNFPIDYEELKSRLSLNENEIKEWIKAKNRIYLNQNQKTGVIEQFEGFSDLKEVDLEYFRKKYGEINAQKFDQVLKLEHCHNSEIDPDKNNYKALKQPDVIMLMSLFPEEYPCAVQKANYEEYEPKTSHGSSLSAGIHSLMAARLGYMEDAYRYYLDTGGMDVDNIMGNSANGIHAASLGATWQALVMGFGGMQHRNEYIRFNPNLPQIWDQLGFSVKLRDQSLDIKINRKTSAEETFSIKVSGDKNTIIPVMVGKDRIKELKPGKTYSAIRLTDGWKWDSEREKKVSGINELAEAISERLKTIFPI